MQHKYSGRCKIAQAVLNYLKEDARTPIMQGWDCRREAKCVFCKVNNVFFGDETDELVYNEKCSRIKMSSELALPVSVV